jgi:hypothetical protein
MEQRRIHFMGKRYFNNKRKPFFNIIRINKDIKKNYPSFLIEVNYNEIIIDGYIKPTDMSLTYKIKIFFNGKERPKVYVVEPNIKRLITKPIKVHMFSDYSLCLYYHKNYEFNPDIDLFSDTIVPWTSMWLYYFELWQYTGEWLGGGIHPVRK